ncbi:MAG: hypothetical protein EOQ99_27930 [Mesorhizobium sp.]|nr:MAG: hypothetical protein EOQ99_27930 [Mesorhizobium sp.]
MADQPFQRPDRSTSTPTATDQAIKERCSEAFANSTYADAILDRLVHNAHRIDLTGESRTAAKAAAKSLTPDAYEMTTINASRALARGRDHLGIRGRNNLGTKGRLRRNRQANGDGHPQSRIE